MNIVLYAATGRAGSAILQELISRGHQVTAAVRHPEKLPAGLADTVKTVRDDLSSTDRIAQVVAGADAVVSAYGAPLDDTDQLVGVTERLIAAVRQADAPRLIVVGGAGSLEYSPGVTVLDSGHWPEAWAPIARSHMKAFAALCASDINWTYFSPPLLIEPGARTGTFRLGKDALIQDEQGNSRISFEDYAIALVDELEKPAHQRSRFTIGY
ncbi:NAD(P)-dependent oxidoreductase [Streptomyces sp. NPDC001493]